MIGVLAYAAPLISVLILVIAGAAQPSWAIALACMAIVWGSLLAGIIPSRRDAVCKLIS